MSYQVIARRWRPRKFAEVVGQEHVTRTIQNALRQGRLAHAFLFTGPRGVGKTSTARILARAVNCPNLDIHGAVEPCNECETCHALLEDREMDVIEMDAASNRGVDDVRRINDTCRLAPMAGNKKIYIIDEVHMLTREAFNAFLKTLEEPPEHVIFILATTDVHKLPATILSRVQRFDFRPVQPADVAPHLKLICDSEGWKADPEALWLISRQAEGSLRDAEGLLDQVISFSGSEVTAEITRDVLGILPGELLAQATRLLAARDLSACPDYLEMLTLKGVDYSELLKSLQSYWADLIFLKENLPVRGKSEDEIAQMKAAGEGLTVEDLFRLGRLAEKLEDDLKWSTSKRVRFETAFLRWATLDRVTTIRDILEKLGGSEAPLPSPSPKAVPTPKAESPKPAPVPAPVAAPPVAEKKTAPVVEAAPKVEETPPPNEMTANPVENSLERVKNAWPEIVEALRKKSHGVAAIAGTHWQPISLDGDKLTLQCTMAGKIATDQMISNFPALVTAIATILNIQFRLFAAPPCEKTKTPEVPAPATPKPTTDKPAGGSDLFANIISRFGGVELDPKQTREPQ